MESLLEKMSSCSNSPKKSSVTKINKHKPSGYSLFTHHCLHNVHLIIATKISLIVLELKIL